MVALVAVILSALAILWNVVQYVNNQRNRRQEFEGKSRQALQSFVDYLADVRSLNKPPEPSGVKLWNRAFDRLQETRRRLSETIEALPPDHPARSQLYGLQREFHRWADVRDYYGDDLAKTHTGEAVLMGALARLQQARVSTEGSLRSAHGLADSTVKGLDEQGLPLWGQKH